MSFETVFLWVSIFLWVAVFLRLFNKIFEGGTSVQALTQDAVLIAIILIMAFLPEMGYISIVPGFSLTLMHLPVLLGAMLHGWKRGLLYGVIFGLTSLVQALISGTGLNALFIYPWISVLPRALFGFLAGWLFQALKKNPKLYANLALRGGLCFALCLAHSLMVYGMLALTFPETMSSLFLSPDILTSGLSLTFLTLAILGSLGEALLGALLVPLLGKTLLALRRNGSH